jgi:hypothetical protein
MIAPSLQGIERSAGQMVMMAADYPFMDVLWTMLIFFLWVVWIWIVVTVLIDVFRRHDIGGFAKAAWLIFVVVLPWLGVLIYLIAIGLGHARRSRCLVGRRLQLPERNRRRRR